MTTWPFRPSFPRASRNRSSAHVWVLAILCGILLALALTSCASLSKLFGGDGSQAKPTAMYRLSEVPKAEPLGMRETSTGEDLGAASTGDAGEAVPVAQPIEGWKTAERPWHEWLLSLGGLVPGPQQPFVPAIALILARLFGTQPGRDNLAKVVKQPKKALRHFAAGVGALHTDRSVYLDPPRAPG